MQKQQWKNCQEIKKVFEILKCGNKLKIFKGFLLIRYLIFKSMEKYGIKERLLLFPFLIVAIGKMEILLKTMEIYLKYLKVATQIFKDLNSVSECFQTISESKS